MPPDKIVTKKGNIMLENLVAIAKEYNAELRHTQEVFVWLQKNKAAHADPVFLAEAAAAEFAGNEEFDYFFDLSLLLYPEAV
jgi:hypothetical protein